MGNDNELKVKITSDASGLKSGSQEGADVFDQAVNKMKASLASLNSAAAVSMSGLTQTVKASLTEAGTQISAFNTGIASISKAMSMIGSAVMLGFIGKEIFDLAKKTGEYAHEMELAAQKTGMSAEALQGLGFAASFAGGSVESITTGMRKFSQEIVHAKEGQVAAIDGFKKLGISVNDLKSMNMEDLLMKVTDAFKAHADGANKSAIAVQMFGRSGLNLIPILNLGRAGVQDLMKTAKDLGVIMSKDDVEAAAGFAQQTKLLHAESEGLQRQMGVSLMPTLSGLVGAMSAAIKPGGQLNDLFKLLPGAINIVAKAVSYVAEGFSMLGTRIGGLAAYIVSFFDRTKGTTAAIKAAVVQDLADIKKHAEEFRASLDKPFKIPKIIKDTAGGDDKPEVATTAPKSDTDKMAGYKAELDQEQIIDGQYNAMSLEKQKAFWEQKLSTVKGGGEKEKVLRMAIQNEIFQLIKKGSEEELSAANEKFNVEMSLAQKATEAKKSELDRQYSLGNISTAQQLQQELALDAQLKAQEMTLFNEWKAIEEKKVGTKQKIANELKKIEEKYNAAVLKDNHKLTNDYIKDWNNMEKQVNQSMASSLTQMINGQKSFSKIIKSLWQQMENAIFGFLLKGVENYLITETDKVNISKAISGLLTTLHFQDATTEIVAKETTVAPSLTADASKGMGSVIVAGVEALEALCSIPYVGPVLGLAAMAGILAAGFAVVGQISSASGGYDIPSGTNPMTQLHQNEMVLPAHLANKVRGMTSNSGGGSNTTYHIQALDTRSFMSRNGSQILKGMKGQMRNMGRRF